MFCTKRVCPIQSISVENKSDYTCAESVSSEDSRQVSIGNSTSGFRGVSTATKKKKKHVISDAYTVVRSVLCSHVKDF